VNVAAQRDDPSSILTLHRRLLALRRDSPVLCAGGSSSPRPKTATASGSRVDLADDEGPVARLA
jgi:hypothetical protein